jgi:hypothetical protein
MQYTISELETRAYLAGDVALSDALAQLDDSQLEIEQLEFDLDEVKSNANTLEKWEERNGPISDYCDFFHDCFARLDGHYPCPSITSDYDKSVIFNAIEKGEGMSE